MSAVDEHKNIEQRILIPPDARTRTVLGGRRTTGPAGGFLIVSVVATAVIVFTIWALDQASAHHTEVARGDINTTAITPQPPAYTPVATPAAPGDVDGDGRPDALKMLPGPRSTSGGPYDEVLRVEGTRIGQQQLEILGGDRVLALVGSVDVNADGFADVVIDSRVRDLVDTNQIVSLTANGLGTVQLDGTGTLTLATGHRNGVWASWGCVGSGNQPGKPGLIQADTLTQGARGWTLGVTQYKVTGSVAHTVLQRTSTVSKSYGRAQVSALHSCSA